MNLAPTMEEEELRAVLRRFLEERSPVADVRARAEAGAGHDRGLWDALEAELSLLSVHVPEEAGGQGLGVAVLAIVAEELGRVLFDGPHLASAVGAVGLARRLEGGPDLQRLVAGGVIGALVAPGGAPAPDLRVRRDGGDRAVIDGVVRPVLGAREADVLLLVTEGPDGAPVAVAIEASSPGLVVEPVDGIDLTRRSARVRLDGVEGTLLGGDVAAALAATRTESRVALAAESLGSAARCLETTLDHVTTRVQFERPIGSFQVVRHRCADLAVELEHARSAVRVASLRADGEDAVAAALAAASALVTVTRAHLHVVRETVQLHGGMGFTWEHDAHLHVRRARASAHLLGGPAELVREVWSRTAAA